MSSEAIDEYLATESRSKIVLTGDRVELDCNASTSRPPDWYLKRHGSNADELINANSNISHAYRILSKGLGHASLIIDSVLPTLAGRYECLDIDLKCKLFVEVTVVGKNIFATSLKEFKSLLFLEITTTTVITLMVYEDELIKGLKRETELVCHFFI